jgi:UDP-N-acetylmuramyl pentapeptide phosphotransferase/UDP-N-acetylglucosamine-1-phosphate transferase
MDVSAKPQSMHDHPIPRVGGLGIVLACMLVGALASFTVPSVSALTQYSLPCVAALLIVAVSFWDDTSGLSPRIRLAAQLIAAALVTYWLVTEAMVAPDMLGIGAGAKIALGVFIIITLTWSANLYNFMDGINGMAGLMGLIGFGAYAIAAETSGNSQSQSVAIVSAIIAGACLGFLPHNFPKSRVFMGDSGSVTLGFCAAAIGAYGALTGLWHWWFPALVFSPLWVDASVTLCKRLIQRQNLMQPHREHYFQRLVLLCGWSHERTSMAYATLALATCASGIWVQNAGAAWAETLLLVGWVVKYALLLSILEWRFTNNSKEQKHNT